MCFCFLSQVCQAASSKDNKSGRVKCWHSICWAQHCYSSLCDKIISEYTVLCQMDFSPAQLRSGREQPNKSVKDGLHCFYHTVTSSTVTFFLKICPHLFSMSMNLQVNIVQVFLQILTNIKLIEKNIMNMHFSLLKAFFFNLFYCLLICKTSF